MFNAASPIFFNNYKTELTKTRKQEKLHVLYS